MTGCERQTDMPCPGIADETRAYMVDGDSLLLCNDCVDELGFDGPPDPEDWP